MSNLVDGVIVSMGGKDFTVPPLTFKQLRTLEPEINKLSNIQGAPSEEQMDAVVNVIHSALSRNYQEITKDEVEDMLDLGNLQKVIGAIMGVSGLTVLGEK